MRKFPLIIIELIARGLVPHVFSLSVCEKALAEYLETKRLSFPRFYFVSSADLLTILSKGNEPTEASLLFIYLFIYQLKYNSPLYIFLGGSPSCQVV